MSNKPKESCKEYFIRKALKFLETQPTAYQFLKDNIYVEPIQEEREED